MNFEIIHDGTPALEDNLLLSEVAGCLDMIIEEGEANDINDAYLESEFQNRVSLIVRNIVNHALQQNFSEAEKYRSKLYRFAPNAIKELFESGKIIEKERSKIHYDRLEKVLTDEEFSAFKKCFVNLNLDKDTLLVKSGVANTRLFFINDGVLKSYEPHKIASKSAAVLKSGCIAGVETFFSLKLPEKNITASAGTNIDCIEGRDFSTLISIFPEIKKKIYKFCKESSNEMNVMNLSDYDRREYERVSVNGVVKVQFSDKKTSLAVDMMQGDLIDISRGGVSFKFTINQHNPKKLRKGQPVRMILEPAGIIFKKAVTWGGTISDVKNISKEEYSVHVRGDRVSKSVSDFLSILKITEHNRNLSNTTEDES